MKLILASGNTGKLGEMRDILANLDVELVAQSALGIANAEETGNTFVENAILKARHAARASGLPALGDDSGICVDALNGAPGLYSARYAGTHADKGGGNSAAEAALYLAEEGARTTMAIWREDWENRDPKAGAMKHWVRTPLEAEVEAGRLKVVLYKHVDEIREDEVTLTTETGESMTLPNNVVFVLVGSDADLTLLKQLGVQTEAGKLAEVPVYDPETFETNVRGVYVAGHFTHARHIKAAIDVPRRIVPLIAQDLKAVRQDLQDFSRLTGSCKS